MYVHTCTDNCVVFLLFVSVYLLQNKIHNKNKIASILHLPQFIVSYSQRIRAQSFVVWDFRSFRELLCCQF